MLEELNSRLKNLENELEKSKISLSKAEESLVTARHNYYFVLGAITLLNDMIREKTDTKEIPQN